MCLHLYPGKLLSPGFFEEDGVQYMFIRNLKENGRMRFVVYNFFGREINACSIFLSVVRYGRS